MAKKDAKFVRIKATVMWAKLNKTNDNGKYEVELTNIPPKVVEVIESVLEGVEVKTNEKYPEKGHYLKIYSGRPIKAFDEEGDQIEGDIVGNGSKAIVTLGKYDWKFKAKSGTSATIKKLVITDLVEYTGGEPDEDEVEEAF